jgi:hypothetical protein
MTMDMFHVSKNNPVFSFLAYHRIFNKGKTMGITGGEGTVYSSWTPGFIHAFPLWVPWCDIRYELLVKPMIHSSLLSFVYEGGSYHVFCIYWNIGAFNTIFSISADVRGRIKVLQELITPFRGKTRVHT